MTSALLYSHESFGKIKSRAKEKHSRCENPKSHILERVTLISDILIEIMLFNYILKKCTQEKNNYLMCMDGIKLFAKKRT